MLPTATEVEMLRKMGVDKGDIFLDGIHTGLNLSHIVILEDAVISSMLVKDGDGNNIADFMTTRNYAGKTLPVNYIIAAGGDNAIKEITLTSGKAQGINY